MEYSHERAVADGVNVDFEVYEIRTRVSEQGATIEARDGTMIGIRDRETRETRWQKPDEDVTYQASQLDRSVVAKDQIRLIIQTFRDKLPTEIFPGRTEVPKTLIFAKDDSHAEDIVKIMREEFGRGNDFCQKITYRTTGRKPRELIQEFRNSYNPRIAVTVDMIATGTDIKPIEVVMFMRTVKSRVLFEQMKGRGVRVIDSNDLKAVTNDAVAKTHFVIVDCVGATCSELEDTRPLERCKSKSFKQVIDHVGFGGTNPDILSSLASRLSRLDRQCDSEAKELISQTSDGISLRDISAAIVGALNPDKQREVARAENSLSGEEEPTEDQVKAAEKTLLKSAVEPLATNPRLRKTILEVKKQVDQIIDEVTKDELLHAGQSESAREKARELVQDFETYLDENKNEIEALQFFYSQPYQKRPRYRDIKELHASIKAPPRSWTPERIWAAYQSIDENKVRGASAERRLTDLVSLVRYALNQDDELVPYSDRVDARFGNWIAQQQNSGTNFSDEQLEWLVMIKDHVAQSLEMDIDDFSLTPFAEEGGLGRAGQVFGKELRPLIDELNEVLAA